MSPAAAATAETPPQPNDRASVAAQRRRTRSFRQSFLVAYAGRIGERLGEAAADAVDAGRERHGEALLPVLASRLGAVDDARDTAFPELGRHRVSATDAAGWTAGRVAAELAHLGVTEELTASA